MNHEIDIAIAIRSTGYVTFSQSGDCAEAVLKQVPLVAAAPELLNALQVMMRAYEGNLPDHCNADWFDEYKQAQSAIAKALGNTI